ncbi:acetyl-CoA carboxylase biotin carboxyl carrier protein subunit [Acidisphaera sp. L21]|jgi:acetyl-CoA carboxylase biotin carboxyl carrier protein|uniref:acetyl-CoA carboxylase biotin carboxyl carrier protein n=1 Tax=Acidisphaera sp. L21 TaxID=1641851 RepID=UPI00131DC676|nr:acetyl-CoA carboxylase biotin carboxyl carrier protein subunit [Acidisphaera sp. L21]
MSRLPIDTAEIRALAEILADTGLTEIEISDGDSRIRVARKPAAIATQPMAPMIAAAIAPAPAMVAAAPVEIADHPGAINSPMVGVAYLSAEPGTPPFVTPGQAVAAGQTLMLIEAMKTFNQIKAPRAGTVTRILVTSGQPVEYGEVLMVLE